MQDFSTSLAVVLNVFLGVFSELFLENILPFPFLFKILFLSLHLGITDGMSLTGNITISFRSTRVTQTFSMQFLGFKNRTDYTAATSSMPPSIWPICPQEPTCVARLSSKKSSSYCSIREKIKTKGSRYRPVILGDPLFDENILNCWYKYVSLRCK